MDNGIKPDIVKIIDTIVLIILVVLVIMAWIDGHFISNTTIIQEICKGQPVYPNWTNITMNITGAV